MKRWVYSGAILLLLAAAFSAVTMARHIWARANAAIAPTALAIPKLSYRAARTAYAFSVVPGGVYDSKELSDSANRDPAVREHYRDVRLEGLWATRTTRPMMVYASYRVGETVRWTKKKLKIPQGELVLTDGYNVVRSRCGNRLRELPPPMSGTTPPPVEDPPEIVFETPGPPIIPQPPYVAPVLVEQAVVQPPAPPLSPPTPPVFPPVVWPPVGPPIPKEHPKPPPVAVTPEPGTLMLFVSGMGLLGGIKWHLRKRK